MSTYVPHDPGHVRLIAALKRMPKSDRVRSQLERIEFCNHTPMGRNSEGEYQSVMNSSGKRITRGWHCNNPLCHKAATSKAEKSAEKYMLRAATRIKFGYQALTLTSVPDPSESLLDAFNTVERARVAFMADPDIKKMLHGGIWRTEVTAGNRILSSGSKDKRSWFVHVHLLVDSNLTKERATLLFRIWGKCLKAEGGKGGHRQYTKSVDRMDAYVRYLRKDMDYSGWTDDEVLEACKFFLAIRAPIMTGAFGSWSDRTKEGRPYADAKRELIKAANVRAPVGYGIEIPEIDFTDVRIISRKTHKHQRDTVLGIYPDVKGHGMEVEQAAAAELIGASIGKFFRKLRETILMNSEVIGMRTGEVFKMSDVVPKRVPRVYDSPQIAQLSP